MATTFSEHKQSIKKLFEQGKMAELFESLNHWLEEEVEHKPDVLLLLAKYRMEVGDFCEAERVLVDLENTT
jgi:thioredoxin-like negative regulator of GroEL